MEKWILDTDIGSDSDDAMALGYLLSRDDIELMGVTTVTGEAHRRALFADIMCGLSGKKVPVVCGSEKSLLGDCHQSKMELFQSEEVDRFPHGDVPCRNDAVLFLKKTIEENPHEIILACIGPLTNVALLFAAYPHIPSLLKGMILMGGRFREDENFDVKRWGVVEWNIKCDPYAAKIVFNADVKELYIAGIEHTYRFKKSGAEVSEKVKALPWMAPASDAFGKMEYVWFHDAVAIWSMLHKDEVKWKKGDILVDLEDADMGKTSFSENPDGKHIALAQIDDERFYDSYAAEMGFKWD